MPKGPKAEPTIDTGGDLRRPSQGVRVLLGSKREQLPPATFDQGIVRARIGPPGPSGPMRSVGQDLQDVDHVAL